MTKKPNKPVGAPSTPQDSRNRPLQTQVQAAFAGPLPPPVILEQYNRIAPGFAERIVVMAEGEAEHRRAMEQRALEANIIANLRARHRETHIGQFLGFLIVVLTIGCGTYAATHGAEIAGGFIGTGGVVSLVTVFIYGRKAN